eukprot:CAMPEP_0118963526 /NCGR_PEP_ID=MMETSP1173-20130426/1384_1 /TAXON_ID=1034831 /ORGANISM="Rhizochromulina marina cf, Strain CCMP1243" /LENGTH=59 /DNA_ID=CAMNT_0006911863 /DNA_START=171 /DNA_END=350 /DNA_ORIENTATION=-
MARRAARDSSRWEDTGFEEGGCGGWPRAWRGAWVSLTNGAVGLVTPARGSVGAREGRYV